MAPPCILARADRLKGLVALITGGATGIGKGIALAMAAEGASIVVNFMEDERPALETVQEIKAMGVSAISLKADVCREFQIKAMFDKAIQKLGTIDILVNNAGVQRDAAFDRMSLEDWEKVIETNLTGAFLCSREAVREFKRRGVVPERSVAAGKIVFVSSVHQVIPWARHVNYAASKGGMMLLMKSLAQEVAGDKIRVNGIAPGAIRTNINRPAWEEPEALEKLLKLIPWGRIGEPEDVGAAAVWLASDESDYVHGTTLYVDGGMTLYPGFATGG